MKSITVVTTILTCSLIGLLVHPCTAAENVADPIELVRDTYRIDRHTLVVEELQLNERESAAFWPLYRSYRNDMDKLGDSLVKLVLEYADVYPNVSEERAAKMLKDYAALEEKIVSTRSRYLKRAAKEVSPTKALRWAQLENRMDLSLRLQLAGAIPAIPVVQSRP
jgi:hypothetical protein